MSNIHDSLVKELTFEETCWLVERISLSSDDIRLFCCGSHDHLNIQVVRVLLIISKKIIKREEMSVGTAQKMKIGYPSHASSVRLARSSDGHSHDK